MQKRTLLHERPSGHVMVGLFVVAAVFLFTWLLVFKEEKVERYELIAEFNTISNISEATKVKLRGFTIGQVQSVEFRPRPPIGEAYFLVTMAIEKIYPVPVGVIAEMKKSGLVGDTFIDLDVSQVIDGVVEAGSRIRGREKGAMNELMTRLTEMAHKLGAAGESIRRADLGYRLGRIGDGIHRAANGVQLVSTSADSLLDASRVMVNRATPEVEKLLVQIRHSTEAAGRMLGNVDTVVVNSREDVQLAIAGLSSALQHLDSVLGRVESFVEQKEGQIDSTLNNLHSTSQSARELAARPWKFFTGTSEAEEDPKVTKSRRSKFRSLRP
tara:strand:- start:7997 stop:8977 length:981 start_codon:yes stop_codon:yes gene_type:complete